MFLANVAPEAFAVEAFSHRAREWLAQAGFAPAG
jgi:hypothetical protein